MNRRRFLLALAATPVAVALAPLAVKAAQRTPSIVSGVSVPTGGPLYAPKYVYGHIRVDRSALTSSGFARAFQLETDALFREMQREAVRAFMR